MKTNIGQYTLLKYFFLFILLCLTNVAMAQTIVISPNTVISHSKTYNNATLDMTNGSFIIKDQAVLTIKNSTITGWLSKKNPILFTVDKGKLNLSHNQVNVKALNIPPHSTTQALHYVIGMATGSVNLDDNHFQVDKIFAVGLLISSPNIPTTGINIVNNRVENFHGVFYLLSTNNALISGNVLKNNSYGNIVLIGSNSKIIGNTVYFSGRNRLGDSIDIIDSNDIVVSKNLLLTPTCRGIYVFNSENVVVDKNRIHGGITYGMNIITYPESLEKDDFVMANIIKNHTFKNTLSNHITVSNNFLSQNRYGIVARDVDNINVHDNIFIQRFEDNALRKFWTNTATTFKNVTNLTWTNNLYKEAYTQEEGGSNDQSDHFVPFPQSGGVTL